MLTPQFSQTLKQIHERYINDKNTATFSDNIKIEDHQVQHLNYIFQIVAITI